MKRKWLLLLLIAAMLLPFYSLSINTSSHALEKDSIEEFLNFEKVVVNLNNNPKTRKVVPLSTIAKGEELNEDVALLSTSSNKECYLVETQNGIKTFSNYALKRIIVSGTLGDKYRANISASYDNLHILSFDSEEETKLAYQELKSDSSLNVILDKLTAPQGYADEGYDYSSYKNIGASAMDIGGYRQYLTDNNITTQAVVVVMDTGINTSHEIFTDRLLTDSGKVKGYSYFNSKYTYSSGNLAFDDDDTNRYSFEDDNGHGSHVAGIVTSLTPNNVKILPIKISNPDNDNMSSYSVMLSAYLRVLNVYSNHYNVVCTNLSFSGAGKDDEEERDEFNAKCYTPLMNKKILCVTGAGNENKENNLEGLKAIVVSALKADENNFIFDKGYSNYGKIIDISAPGTAIESAWINESNGANSTIYRVEQGTSMASPQVAAVIALLKLHPDLAQAQASILEEKLYSLALDLDEPGKDIYNGHGIANLKYFDVEKEEELSFIFNNENITTYVPYRNFGGELPLVINCTSSNYKIYYTTDGSFPTTTSEQFITNEPIKINSTTYIYAIGYKIENGTIVARTELYNISFFNLNSPVENYFKINNGRLIKYTGKFKNLVIPEIMKGITITSLDPSLFKWCDFERVILPETMTSISGWAFSGCKNLKYIYAPGVIKIYGGAFMDCTSLPSVNTTEPETATEGAFFPKLNEIVSQTFYGCTSLQSVEMTGINFTEDNEGFHFAECTSLRHYKFQNTNGIFPKYLFYNCTKLTGIIRFTNVNFVGEAAYYGCNISGFRFEGLYNKLYTDGKALYSKDSIIAFANGVKNTSYEILSNVTILGEQYPITKIAPYALGGCSFSTLIIPQNITLLDKHAIINTEIDTLYYKATNLAASGYWDDAKMGLYDSLPKYIRRVDIADNVVKLPKRLFQNVQIDELAINSYATVLQDCCFYRNRIPGVKKLYLNFNQKMTRSYLTLLTETTQLFANDVEIIYSKVEVDLTYSSYISKSVYPYMYYNGNYYIYTKAPLANFNITATAGTNGSISPTGTTKVTIGDNLTYTFTAQAGYKVSKVYVDGVQVKENNSNLTENTYTFVNVIATHSIHVTFIARNDIKYTVNHYQQVLTSLDAIEISGKYYKLIDTQNLTGTTDTKTTATARSFNGFTAQPITQVTILADGSSVLTVLYDRNSYQVELTRGNGIERVEGSGLYLYGQIVTILAKVSNGFEWEMWTSSNPDIIANSNLISYSFEMPTHSLAFSASAQPVYYTVKFYNDDGSLVLDSVNVKYYETAVFSKDTPYKPSSISCDYVFEKWVTTIGGNEEAHLSEVTKNFSVYAKFKMITKIYTVKFYNEDREPLLVNGSESQQVEYGKEPIFPSDVSKQGTKTIKYVFDKWLTGDGTTISNYKISQDSIFYASYKEYAVMTYDNNNAIVYAQNGRATIHVTDFKTIGTKNLKFISNDIEIIFKNESLFKVSIKSKDVTLSVATGEFDLPENITSNFLSLNYYDVKVSCDGNKMDNIDYTLYNDNLANSKNLSAWAYDSYANKVTKTNHLALSDKLLSFDGNTSYNYLTGEQQKNMLPLIILISCGGALIITILIVIICKSKKPRRGLLN